ncbi:MAG TPA: hypothetical protein VMD99_03275 [Terriglobales bacterium]|nr:hypothetical protein [Terriglobales bacterium]
MNLRQTNLLQSILLAMSLGMIAGLVACSSSSSPMTTTPVIAISANSGYTAGTAVGTAFGTLAVTVTSNGTPASGVSVTFTAPAAGAGVATGTFATSPAAATDTETTNASGVATSQIFTAGTVAGSYTVTATTSGATTPANFALTNNAGAPNAIAVYSGTPQNAVISTAYGALAAQVTDGDGNLVTGTQVTFTVVAGSTGAAGTFATTTTTDTETTGANGVATTSQTLTANGTIGMFTVTADFAGDTGSPATFTLTNVPVPPLAAGTYVYSVAGTDSGVNSNGASPYYAAGVFSVDITGTITGGELDFSDFNVFSHDTNVTGTIATTTDGNLLITLNTGDSNFGPSGNGTLVFNAAMASASKGLITEFDTWASGTGQLNLQTSTSGLCPNASSSTPCGYSFFLTGVDSNEAPIAVGGVFSIDSAGGISGTGSVFDANDEGVLYPDQTVSVSSVSAPDSMGFVTISLNSSLFTISPGIQLDGYIIDANHIRLVENWLYNNASDGLGGTTGGTALAQTGTGGFSSTSISGSSYVIGTVGMDTNGPLAVAGALAFNADGTTMSGTLNYNDGTLIAPQGGVAISGGTYTVDPTGRVTVTGLTDAGADFTYHLQLYLTGDGHATVISMDAGTSYDVQAGSSWQQDTGLSTSSVNGNYAFGQGQFFNGTEADGDGAVVITSATTSLTGYLDVNYSLEGLTPIADNTLSATFAATSANGVLTVTGNGVPTHESTLYLVDGTQGVLIESDDLEVSLGYFANQ